VDWFHCAFINIINNDKHHHNYHTLGICSDMFQIEAPSFGLDILCDIIQVSRAPEFIDINIKN
jgi:hypothetical protein